MKKNALISLVFSLFYSSLVLGQDNFKIKFAESITAHELKSHLTIVASDSFEGRETGMAGQKMAAAYISREFKKYGLTPPVKVNDSLSYYQRFNVFLRSWDDPYILVKENRKGFLLDFFSIGNPNLETEQELELVVEYLGPDANHKFNWSNIKGKGVVLLEGKMDNTKPSEYSQKMNNLMLTSNYNKRYKQLLDSGAKALFVLPGIEDSIFSNFILKYKCDIQEKEFYLNQKKLNYNNTFFISPSLAAELIGVSRTRLREFYEKTSTKLEEVKTPDLKKIKIKAFIKTTSLPTENVLGLVEGSDKKDEVLVVTAHYDHEGIKCGKIYNGADDDGTGTVSILEMAQAFSIAKKEGKGPRRSILFMAVTGEEKGLLGSLFYTDNPVFPLAQTIADLNIDMIGRIDEYHKNENYIYLIGSNRLSTELHQISEDVNKRYIGMNFDYTYNATDDPNQFYYRSDHYNFAKNNIPVIFYFSGVHADYHQPTDDVDKILFKKVETTARLIFLTAWELANRDARITVDAK